MKLEKDERREDIEIFFHQYESMNFIFHSWFVGFYWETQRFWSCYGKNRNGLFSRRWIHQQMKWLWDWLEQWLNCFRAIFVVLPYLIFRWAHTSNEFTFIDAAVLWLLVFLKINSINFSLLHTQIQSIKSDWCQIQIKQQKRQLYWKANRCQWGFQNWNSFKSSINRC